MSNPHDDILPLIPGLRAYARSLAGRDLHLADDVVRETILLALRGWSQLTPGTNLKSWLLQIAHNRFYNLRCRSYRPAEIHHDDLASLASISAEQEQRNELPDFERAFAALSSSHREVLGLIVIQELTYKDAAAVCGCAVGTVRTRMSRARAILKQTFLGQPGSVECPTTLEADVPLAVARRHAESRERFHAALDQQEQARLEIRSSASADCAPRSHGQLVLQCDSERTIP